MESRQFACGLRGGLQFVVLFTDQVVALERIAQRQQRVAAD